MPILLILLAMALVSCSGGKDSESCDFCDAALENSSSSNLANTSSSLSDALLLEDMYHVLAKGDSTYLGTDLESAKLSDRPKMKVTFDYNFYMGIHEVTCGEFNALMKSKTGLVDSCENDSLPVTDVTYYDAILFANARSVESGFDTAYTYSSARFDNNHNCIGMEKLNFDASVDAYRLPTEAEWVFVASSEWNEEQGWNNGNSDYTRHKVCSRKDSVDRFCDMAGNAMEWVNDWLGTLQDTSISNYMGSLNANLFGERVLKGGSYVNAPDAINLYSRGDVYTVSSATDAPYVGFRLAFGHVENGTWMDGSTSTGERLSTVETSVSEMYQLLGTYRAKLAFRNDVSGNIAFVNFADGVASISEIRDTLNCYHPEISPDGEWVAFSTKYEGISGTSSLYVRRLNVEGTDLVHLDVKSAVIPRWRVIDGDTVIVYVSDAGSNKDESAFKEKSTWKVPFVSGKFGTPVKLWDGSYHGGITNDKSMAVTGSPFLRVMASGDDSVWYNSEQACNVSLLPESKETLFLDFGGSTGRSFDGQKYGTHERILIADSTGKLKQMIPAPTNDEFDHTEWNVGEGDSRKIVATLVNVNGAHGQIVLVNPGDSSITELVSGGELWHPCLWIGECHEDRIDVDESLDLDSAGAYYSEGSDWIHELMRVKMGLFWQLKDSIETLCVGSSRVEDGIIPTEMKSGFALNMGHPSNNLMLSVFYAENYGLNHLKNLKTIVISLDLGIWQDVKTFYEEMVYTVPGYLYDANHDFWKDSLPKGFVTAVNEAYPASEGITEYYTSTLGYVIEEASGWGDPLVEHDSAWCDSNRLIIPRSLSMLEDLLAMASKKDVQVVGVIFPQNPAYAETGSWGRYGPTRSAARAIMDSLAVLEDKYGNFTVMDENKMGAHDYDDSMAENTDHLSKAGASKFTARLDSLIESIISE